MQLFSIFATLAAAAVAAAQNQTVTIMVGGEASSSGGIFQFIPNTLNATNGSVITFEWTGSPGNHSVTQSSFNAPCTPLQGGFDSGWILIAGSTTLSPPPSWDLMITDDSTPIWFYCKQLLPSPHCNSGMVGGINIKPGPNSLAAFQKAAAAAGPPGQAQGSLAGVGASASVGPFIPSGAVFFPSGGPTATAPAPGASGSGGATSGGSPTNSASSGGTSGSGTPPPSGAIPTVSFDMAKVLGTVVVGVWIGMAVVL